MEFGKSLEHNLATVSAVSCSNGIAELTPEIFVFGLLQEDDCFKKALHEFGGDESKLEKYLLEVIDFSDEPLKGEMQGNYAKFDMSMDEELSAAFSKASQVCNSNTLESSDILYALLCNGSDVIKYITESGVNPDQINDMISYYFQLTIAAYGDDSSDEESVSFGQIFGGMLNQQEMHLEDFCTDMLETVKKHQEPLVGREKEIDRTIRVLCRKEKSNVIHLGEAGVGKTAIAIGIAKRIVEDNVPEKIKGSEFYSLDVGALVAGTRYRGDLEQRMKFVIDTLKAKEKVILYIDEIHMITGGGAEGSMNLANLIKTALTDTGIRFIGATTFKEYKDTIEKDNAFARRFKTIDIIEPSAEETKKIINGIIHYYSEFHNVKYTPESINAAVDLTVKYIHDKFLPDKAIDIIDECGAYLSKNNKAGATVDRALVETIISENCRIPKETVTAEDNKLIFKLEDKVKSQVFGQDEAIAECVKAIKLSRAGLTMGNKPVANLLFVGQTGVGKTEIARQVASALNIDFVKFDMSEYMDATSVNKLIGASAGYVGYDDGGLLVEEIRKHPHCVLLLDEIEKAHPAVFNVLLQVMDDAKLTDNKGRMADFKNVIIIMTSNAGASGVMKKGLGFGSEDVADVSEMSKAVEKIFTPEFRNRLTKVIVLNSMNKDMARNISKKLLNNLKTTLEAKGIDMKYTNSVVDYCVKHGISKEYGARPIIRLINDDINMLLVDGILEGSMKNCKLSVKNDKIVVTK